MPCRSASATLTSILRGAFCESQPNTGQYTAVQLSLVKNTRLACSRSTTIRRLGAKHLSAVSCILLATCVPLSVSHGQTIDLNLETSLGSGATISSTENQSNWERTSTNLQVNVGLVLDEDRQFEWVIGTIIQVEDRPAVALNPKLKIVRQVGAAEAYATLGVPWFVTPFRRLGVELGGGMIGPVNDIFSWVGNLSIQTFFAGADVPDGTTVLVLNVAFGARISF